MSNILTLLLATAAFASAIPAQAAISIVGSGLGRECFLAAELKRDTRTGLDICARALDESGRAGLEEFLEIKYTLLGRLDV